MPALCVAKLARADRGSGGGGGGAGAGGNVQHYTCSITMPFVFASLVITPGSILDLGKQCLSDSWINVFYVYTHGNASPGNLPQLPAF